MTATLFGFRESAEAAARLAKPLDIGFSEVSVHRFPDGESLVRVEQPSATAILYRSLDDPNAKLVELLLAAAALRDNGARQVHLVAPYLCYMRQDIAFLPGQAVSQRVIGKLLAEHFNGVLTVDPHLHRVKALSEVMPGTDAASVTAAPALSAAIGNADDLVLVGPDSESRQWVEAIATPLSCPVLVGNKQREGDRKVTIAIEGIDMVAGYRAVLVDDVIASGETLAAAARLLRDAGATSVEAVVTHCLAGSQDLAALHSAGIFRIRATDSVPGPVSEICLAGLLAGEIRTRRWNEEC